MNLEQRVQALEQEVQLLKAQIQVTLLDIQEQLLNAKYPTLRVGELDRGALPAEIRPETSMKSAAPVKTIRITSESEPESDIEVMEEEKERPSIRNNRPRIAAPVEEPKSIQPSRTNWTEAADSIPQVSQEPNGRDWIELENWVSQKVEKLGIKRTRELINLYAQQEQFTRRERELLMQFVGIYGEGSEKTQPSRLPYSTTEPEDSHPTIVPQTRAVVEEIRAELRQKQNAKKSREAVAQPLNDHQELVLRLIAGILNAGDEVPPGVPKNGQRNY